MNKTKFSKTISRLFFLPWLLIVLLTTLKNSGLSMSQVQILVPVLLFFNIGIPFSAYNFLYKKKLISDVDITKREERYLLFGLTTAAFLISLILVYFLGNFEFFVLSLIMFIAALTLFIVTLKWKISGHMILNAAAITIMVYLFGPKMLWLLPIIPLVGFARVYLKKHTLKQVIAGTIVGLGEPYLVLKLFGLI